LSARSPETNGTGRAAEGGADTTPGGAVKAAPAAEAEPGGVGPEPNDERSAAPESAEVTRRRQKSIWRELPVLIVIAFAIALLIKSFLLQAFFIPSGSMIPTLVEGDRVLVEKVSYRFGEADRGDVIVFERSVADTGGDEDGIWTQVGDAFKELFGFPTDGQDLIKRVIAVGGETVSASEGQVQINGEPIDEPYLPEGTTTEPFGPIVVPEDSVFVMGDNRDGSDDSRVFGPIPTDTIVGRALMIVWPPGDIGGL
jgi:signal peptidase I